MDASSAGGSAESRAAYNWHPAVHDRHFDETLYFVMIRLHEPLHRPVADQVKDLLKDADIKYACAYPLFGWWDALVRVWLTPTSYKRFIRVLQDSVKLPSSEHNIEDHRSFATTSIRYYWSDMEGDLLDPDMKTRTKIAQHHADIDQVATAPEATVQEAWSRLEEADLLFFRPTMKKGAVKFYTCLERTSDAMPLPREIEAIVKAMESTRIGSTDIPMINRSSLYCGDGPLASYLVRCVADSFDDVLGLAESFDIHLKETGLRPMTLLVANPRAVLESDLANNQLHVEPSDERTIELLDLKPAASAEIPTEHRHELRSLVLEACALAEDDEELRGVLLDVLRASAKNDNSELRASLSYLLDFEPEFKPRLKREFGEVFGKDWLEEIRKLCEASEKHRRHAEEKMSERIEKWSLGVFRHTARAVSELNPRFRGRLVSQLGEDWDDATGRLVLLRNDLSHGRVYEIPCLNVYGDEITIDDRPPIRLANYLREAMEAGIFWWRSRDENGKTTREDEGQ